MSITYGMAEYDRYTGLVDWNIHLPMDGVKSGTIYDFFRSAGEEGWELCAAFPAGVKGMTRTLPTTSATRVCEEAAEEMAFIFKKAQ